MSTIVARCGHNNSVKFHRFTQRERKIMIQFSVKAFSFSTRFTINHRHVHTTNTRNTRDYISHFHRIHTTLDTWRVCSFVEVWVPELCINPNWNNHFPLSAKRFYPSLLMTESNPTIITEKNKKKNKIPHRKGTHEERCEKKRNENWFLHLTNVNASATRVSTQYTVDTHSYYSLLIPPHFHSLARVNRHIKHHTSTIYRNTDDRTQQTQIK